MTGRTETTDWTEAQVTTKVSPRSVAATVTRLTEILSAKGMKVFAVIDQREQAQAVGLELRETTLVLFGSPAAGTPVMDTAPLSALDLPLKVLIWADDAQAPDDTQTAGAPQTKVSYYGPAALAARYALTDQMAARLAGIDPLTDALIAD